MSRSDVCSTSPPSTAAPRSVVDAATWARTDAEARTIIAVAYQQDLVRGDEVERVVARVPGVRRHRLILDTARDARGGSLSLGELDLVALCRDAGLPVPERQVVRQDAAGRTRYLDAPFSAYGVRVEIDGAHHMSADQWWQDMARHNALARRGEVVLRFPAWMVRDHPSDVADSIRRALRDAGWQ